MVERHPLQPFLPKGARVLFLGSFPPPRQRWCMDFFYPNWINDHWRIEGLVFYGERDYFVDNVHKTFRLEAIKEHCIRHGIAFYDTATAVRRLRDNASDKYLEVVEPTDISALIAPLSALQAIVTTGQKATETICLRINVPQMPAVNQKVQLFNCSNVQKFNAHTPLNPLNSWSSECHKNLFLNGRVVKVVERSSTLEPFEPLNLLNLLNLHIWQ